MSLPPVQYHVEHNRAHFFLDDSSAANALHRCSHKITDTDGYKVCWCDGNVSHIAAQSLSSLISYVSLDTVSSLSSYPVPLTTNTSIYNESPQYNNLKLNMCMIYLFPNCSHAT